MPRRSGCSASSREGHALLFPSGSGATTALLLTFLETGRTVAIAKDAYYGTGTLMRALEPWGLRMVEFDQTGPPPEGVDLVWLESPSNPLLTLPDLDAASAHPAPVVVDSTASTPVYLRALEQGADFVLHSATKFLGGHHDVLLGAVVCKSRGRLRAAPAVPQPLGDRGCAGRRLAPAPKPGDARAPDAPAHRERNRDRAKAPGAPAVERVRYPGFGGLLSFDVAGGAEAAQRVERSVRAIKNATSLGGTRSVLETRARWEGDRVPENLVRLSVGLEDAGEIWADLEQALGG